ncbi:hypothetical protein [Legionella pneumophila]|uniref:hypothetical protein n=1 Tax=Legionella pneumophila TaxID=446 RepID=UPI0001527639|nr:hypothetical protein [Legionella pneumophila]HAT8879189.1 hypothetical protein [Legionella pneumophila subsp. pneumophila]ABQ54204.1 hypothetical protein LPC_0206 [Legionella pneumophila str. Corby]ADG23441.1 hypothetical protein lpa_00276 [Legionella pneumophila 2300/99 Alcoy]CZH77621.1 Uncharacterised protein [Legionella pneumophila]CZH84175.1 Uncharacterised protein [Legionella pneumophila]
MDDSIFVKGIEELKRLIATQYDLTVSAHKIENGKIIISLANKRKNLVLNELNFRDAIEFLPNSPTNDKDKEDRHSLFLEIKNQLS